MLCLKFDKDWDLEEGDDGSWCEDDAQRIWRRGFMVSGSSDCSICVWALYARPGAGDGSGDGEVAAEMAAVLRGHSGGVLDLRIDSRWIVSWYVDPLIISHLFL